MHDGVNSVHAQSIELHLQKKWPYKSSLHLSNWKKKICILTFKHKVVILESSVRPPFSWVSCNVSTPHCIVVWTKMGRWPLTGMTGRTTPPYSQWRTSLRSSSTGNTLRWECIHTHTHTHTHAESTIWGHCQGRLYPFSFILHRYFLYRFDKIVHQS